MDPQYPGREGGMTPLCRVTQSFAGQLHSPASSDSFTCEWPGWGSGHRSHKRFLSQSEETDGSEVMLTTVWKNDLYNFAMSLFCLISGQC